MFASLFKLLENISSFFLNKEENKYKDEYIYLKNEFYKEYNKPIDVRDMARIMDLKRRISLLADSNHPDLK